MAYLNLSSVDVALAAKLITLITEVLNPTQQELLEILRLRVPKTTASDMLFDTEFVEDVFPDAASAMKERCQQMIAGTVIVCHEFLKRTVA